jgi:hypothetical protein
MVSSFSARRRASVCLLVATMGIACIAACSDDGAASTGSGGSGGADGAAGGSEPTSTSSGSTLASGSEASGSTQSGSGDGGAGGSGGDGGGASSRGPDPVLLGAAGDFVILAKSAIANDPISLITGDVGLSPAAASYVTGLSMTRVGTYWTSAQVVGRIYAADNDPPTPIDLTTAVGNMEAAYTDAFTRSGADFLNLGDGEVGGLTLAPGLYRWESSVTIPEDVTIAGGADDVWIFQVTGDLSLEADMAMILGGGARAENVFWQVAGNVDFGAGAHAEGIVLAETDITLQTGASIDGRLLSQTAVNVAAAAVTGP